VPAAAESVSYKEASTEALQHALWRAGDLSWTLHADQFRVYSEYRDWARLIDVNDFCRSATTILAGPDQVVL
jgi:hypothetical protein